MTRAIKAIKPGDIGLTRIGGFLGFLVSLGQHFAGDSSKYTHTYIVLDDETVIAGQPGGARIDKLSDYKNKAIYIQLDLTDEQRDTIVREAKTLEGTPYSFLDYIAIGLARFGIKPKWLTNFIKNTGHMICSQLCDEVYRRAGVHLFNDGRLPQEVTPGDLLYVLAGEDNWIEIQNNT
jgi:hypothetical protein